MSSCGTGMVEISDDEILAVEITGTGPLGDVFVWRAELDYSWSYCVEDCDNCIGLLTNDSIDDFDGSSYSVSSSTWWSYEGNVTNDIDVETDEYTPYVNMMRQDLYNGGNIFGFPMGAANPYVELKGNARGGKEILDWGHDTRTGSIEEL